MVCTFISDYNKHLGFFGVLISTFAALLFIYKAREILRFSINWSIDNSEKQLKMLATKMWDIDAEHRENYKVLTQLPLRKRALRRWRHWCLRPTLLLALYDHNRLRRQYKLQYCGIQWPQYIVRHDLISGSFKEIRAQVPELDESYSFVDHRLTKFAIIMLLTGAILLMTQSFPWC